MNSEFDPKVSEMHDVAVARNLIDDTFDLTTPGRRSIVIGLTIAALKRVERALALSSPEVLRERPRQWTERRVRSIVDNEARRIDAYEIDDLQKVKLAEARHEFHRSTAKAARLAAFLAHRDEDFHSADIALQVALAGGMAGPGAPLAAHGSDRTGARADHQGELTRPVGGARNRGAAE